MSGVLQQLPGLAAPVASLRPRLLVYESPTADALLPLLGQLFPDLTLQLQAGRPRADCVPSPGTVPVWHLAALTADALEQHAELFLRDFAYPLAASGSPFVLSLPFPKKVLEARALNVTTVGRLDVEDIAKLLASDAVAEQKFSELHLLASQIPLTPIEELLQEGFEREGVMARSQVRVGRFIVDFLVESNGNRLAVEADGHAFHDRDRDAARELVTMGIGQVVRFTGRQIVRNADACARQVASLLKGSASVKGWCPRRESLDPSQARAVTHGRGQARVLAPAGAGKTRVLVERIAELVASGVEPSSILALAFNRKANEQLTSELKLRGIPVSDRRVRQRRGWRPLREFQRIRVPLPARDPRSWLRHSTDGSSCGEYQ